MSDEQNVTTTQTETPNPNVAEFMQHFNDLKDQVSKDSDTIREFVDSRNREAVNKEVSNAAGKINEKVGGDAEMAELFLEKQYAKDPNLKKVWDNRAENPEALEAALGVLTEEWAAKNSNMIDPQVAENQRALKESQSTGGTVQVSDKETELSKLGDGEFLSAMRRMRQ